MTHDSTAHLPKPADPAQMSDWKRTAFTVEATVYYPERVFIGAIAEGRGWQAIYRRGEHPTTRNVGVWPDEAEACAMIMEFAGVNVKK